MLLLSMTLGSKEDEVIIRDEGGNKLCEIMISQIRSHQVRLVFNAPKHVLINRRSVDDTKTWGGPWPACVICKCPLHGVDADASGVAHRICAERELKQ